MNQTLLKKILRPETYLNLAEVRIGEPTFYHCPVYLSRFKMVLEDGWLFPEDDGWAILEPLNVYPNPLPEPKVPVWAKHCGEEFLDLEYIYDPEEIANVLTTAGRNRASFRKNVRKWPREHRKWVYQPVTQDRMSSVALLAATWAEERQDSFRGMEDLIHAVENGQIHVLIDLERDEVVAVNIWSENWKYVNYRWNLCNGDPFVSEFSRWLFYACVNETRPGKEVNDGGVLGQPGLQRFKDKLGPIWIKELHSDRREA